jgi:hypothetical protein
VDIFVTITAVTFVKGTFFEQISKEHSRHHLTSLNIEYDLPLIETDPGKFILNENVIIKFYDFKAVHKDSQEEFILIDHLKNICIRNSNKIRNWFADKRFSNGDYGITFSIEGNLFENEEIKIELLP